MGIFIYSYNGTNEANVTTTSQDDGTQRVTGQTVFWSIVALALNAMAQTSITTDLYFGTDNMFKGGLSPQMSSPIVCATDAMIELALLVVYASRKIRSFTIGLFHTRPRNDPDFTPTLGYVPAIYELVSICFVLFVFAVLPPAIKVFGMTGVPGVKMIVTAYLAAPCTRTMCMMLGDDMRHEKKILFVYRKGSIQVPGSILTSVTGDESTRDATSTSADVQASEGPARLYMETTAEADPVRSMSERMQMLPLLLEKALRIVTSAGLTILEPILFILHFFAYSLWWLPFSISISTPRSRVFDVIEITLRSVQTGSLVLSGLWACGPLVLGRWLYDLPWWPRTSPFVLFPLPCLFWYSLRNLTKIHDAHKAGGSYHGGTWSFFAIIAPSMIAALILSVLLEFVGHFLLGLIRHLRIATQQDCQLGVHADLPDESLKPESAGDMLGEHSAEIIWPYEIEWISESSSFRRMFGLGVAALWAPPYIYIVLGHSTSGSEDEQRQARELFNRYNYWNFSVRGFWAFLNSIRTALQDSRCPQPTKQAQIEMTDRNRASRTAQDISPPANLTRTSTAELERGETQFASFSTHKRVYRLMGTAGWALALLLTQIVLQGLIAILAVLNPRPHLRLVSVLVGHLKGERLWIVFAIFNLITALIKCFLGFDGTDTINPSWTQWLG